MPTAFHLLVCHAFDLLTKVIIPLYALIKYFKIQIIWMTGQADFLITIPGKVFVLCYFHYTVNCGNILYFLVSKHWSIWFSIVCLPVEYIFFCWYLYISNSIVYIMDQSSFLASPNVARGTAAVAGVTRLVSHSTAHRSRRHLFL